MPVFLWFALVAGGVSGFGFGPQWTPIYSDPMSSCLFSSRSGGEPSPPLSNRERRQESLVHGNDPLLSLNMNLDALARANAPERAQELYQRIAALHREGYYDVQPDVVSFNSVLKALQNDPERALEFWEAEAVPGQANVRSYNTFLLALARSGMYESAENLLRQMQVINAAVRPDLISWNTVLLSYATAEDDAAVHRAEDLIREMMTTGETTKHRYDELTDLPSVVDESYKPPTPDATSFNTLISAWSGHSNPKLASRQADYWLKEMQQVVKPDVVSYTTVLKAHKRLGNRQAAERALELLDEMRDSDHAQPNAVAITVVIQALCSSRQMDKAEHLLANMEHPDIVAYTSVMDGWCQIAKSCARKGNEEGRDEAASAVFAMFQQLHKLSPRIRPNSFTYTVLLKTVAAHGNRDAGLVATGIIKRMWQDHTAGTAEAPSTIHYNAALACYNKAAMAQKAIKADLLYKDMLSNGVPPDTITYNTLISTAATSFGPVPIKQKSFAIGQKAFETVTKKFNPTSLTFYSYLRLLRRLGDPETREMTVIAVFQMCCEAGCLNKQIVKQLTQILGGRKTAELIGFDAGDSLQFPTEWTENAV